MEFEFVGAVKMVLQHQQGAKTSTLKEVNILLDPISPLDNSMYNNPDGTFTEMGAKAFTNLMVQGLSANIHACHQAGIRDSAEHLRYAIAELEKSFVAIAKIDTTTFKTT